MKTQPAINLRLSSTSEGLQALHATSSGGVEFKEIHKSKDPTTNEFGFAELGTMITIVQGVAGIAQLAMWITPKLDKKHIYKVQGPARTVVIKAGEGIDQDAVEKLLRAAAGIVK